MDRAATVCVLFSMYIIDAVPEAKRPKREPVQKSLSVDSEIPTILEGTVSSHSLSPLQIESQLNLVYSIASSSANPDRGLADICKGTYTQS